MRTMIPKNRDSSGTVQDYIWAVVARWLSADLSRAPAPCTILYQSTRTDERLSRRFMPCGSVCLVPPRRTCPPNNASPNSKIPPENFPEATDGLQVGELVAVRGFEPRSRG